MVLNSVVESVIAGELQKLKDANNPSPPNNNKPYPALHNEVSFLVGYHQPKFQMFDDSSDPYQHLTRFTSAAYACGDSVRNELLLLWQFILSLKCSTFDCYSKLPPNSILNWPFMKATFLNHLYNMGRQLAWRSMLYWGRGRMRGQPIIYGDAIVKVCIAPRSWVGRL